MSSRSRSYVTYLMARLLPALATFAVTLVCIQALPAHDYALYSVSLLGLGLAAGFVNGLSAQPMLRYALELSPTALRRGLLGVPLAMATGAGVVMVAFMAWRFGVSPVLLVAVTVLPGLALMDTRRSLFIAQSRPGDVLALDGIRSLLSFGLLLVLLPLAGAVAISPMLAQLGAVAVALLLVRPGRARIETPVPSVPAGERAVDRHYLGFGVALAIWTAVMLGLALMERSVLGGVVGLAATSAYAAQSDVINAVFAAGGGALGASMMGDYLARDPAPDRARLRKLLGAAGLGVIGLGLVCIAAGVVLSMLGAGPLPGVQRLAGVLSNDVATALTLIAAAAIWTFGGFAQKPLELRGRSVAIVASIGISALCFVVLAPAAADRFGSVGVAGAKAVAGLTYCALVLVVARHGPAAAVIA